MILLLAFAIPVVVGGLAFVMSGKRITPKELAAQLAAMLLVLGVTYACMLSGSTSDTELWNGSIASKTKEWGSCCHSYPCNCRQVCSGGKDNSCSTVCDTCYLHAADVEWYARSTTGRTVYSNTCNSPGSSPPARWDRIYVGEPTAEERGFTNYIRGNHDTLFRREGVSASLLAEVPAYPGVYDYYQSDRFMSLGVQGVDVAALNHELSFINAQLGARKQVNIIVVVTRQADPTFVEALRQKWLGGKKNDVVVLIGAPDFPQIAWADVVSWTQREDMKINLRDRLLALQQFDGHKVLGVTAYEVDQEFTRRRWQDFDYLKAGIQPTSGETTALFIVAVLLSLAMSIVAWREDVFDEERAARRGF